MKYIKIILQISVLFLFYYIGEAIQSAFSLFIPGSIIGMLLFFALLTGKIIRVEWIADGIDLLMKDMPIFFVPVTVGVVQYLDFFYGKGSLMIPLVMLSTFLIIGISGLITSLLLKKEVDAHD
ncbi:CidA/LrgA family protein [Gracilibacillus sp. D59]|uniref:CidA/LrgA family protein n=1 Tax=Gracilibacillus sp. D59 TaxID=3457434 RepID=UPI003FCEA29B